MRKINYFKNCENEYLKYLGLKDDKNNFTEIYKKLDKSWKALKNKNIKKILPLNISDLIIGSYEQLVSYFICLTKLSKTEYEQVKIDIKNVFIYKGVFDKKIADFFIDYGTQLDIYSCFYCDSSFSGIYKFNRTLERTFDVDHFFPNEQYPMFSISLFNFVPSCQVCNSRVKGSSNFFDFYGLEKKSSSLQRDLLELAPISKKFDITDKVKISIYPNIHYYTYYRKSYYKPWHYNPCFHKANSSYQVIFDVEEKSAVAKHVSAFKLEERYNNIAIKSQGLYLMDLKRKYPDSNIKWMSEILSNRSDTQKEIKRYSFDEIKKAIFHQDDKYALLQKLRDDILGD